MSRTLRAHPTRKSADLPAPRPRCFEAIYDAPLRALAVEYEHSWIAFWTVENELQGDEAKHAASANEGGADTFPVTQRHTLQLSDADGTCFSLRLGSSTDYLSGRMTVGHQEFDLHMGRRQLEGFFEAVRELEARYREQVAAASQTRGNSEPSTVPVRVKVSEGDQESVRVVVRLAEPET